MTAARRTIIGVLLAVFVLVFLGVSTGIFLFCASAWCPDFALAKRHAAVDYASCELLGFTVEQTSPPRCIAGSVVYFASDVSRFHIIEPHVDQAVALPLVIAGDVRVGSGTTAQLLLADHDGFALVEDAIHLSKALSGQVLPFRTTVTFPRPMGTGGTLHVSLLSHNGSTIEDVRIPVRFLPSATVEIKAFFSNSERDPETQYCDVSYPVARRVTLDEDLLTASLHELLRGPTISEQRQHFSTNLPEGVEIRALRKDDGHVMVTFTQALLKGTAGSCRVQAIRSQIERTLKQFSSVNDVTITVEGIPDEEVLQP
ncbi:MAG: GerMN domain-containing protein [Candidatus Peregrinibacteria bacterium]